MGIVLDKRLSLIASLCEGACVADVGCDHGKLACYLAKCGRAERVIAADISEKCLAKARTLAREYCLSKRVETVLSDGLDKIHNKEADTVVISGLGGDVIAEIIKRAYSQSKSFDCFVICANSHAEKARAALNDIVHEIVFDTIVYCGGKIYTVIKSKAIAHDCGADNAESEAVAKANKRADLKNKNDDADANEPQTEKENLDRLQLLFGKFYKSDESFKIFAKAELGKKLELLALSPESEKLNADIKNLTEALK